VPHRQVVLTLPKRLRPYCLYRRRLLGEIARVAAQTVTAGRLPAIGTSPWGSSPACKRTARAEWL